MDEEQAGVVKNEVLFQLDDLFYECWSLGKNIILGWSPSPGGIDVLVVPHYVIGEAIAPGRTSEAAGTPSEQVNIGELIQQIVAGEKMLPMESLQRLGRLLQRDPLHLALPYAEIGDFPHRVISSLVKRYSITFVHDRAVALFDVVGFSRYSPLEQAVQLNSLAYSVNTAYSKLMDRKIKIRFARTTTGDGFYVWNRDRSLNANIDLYHFMHLVLADNAIARSKARGNTTPMLRACFHVGGHYEFYQSEGLNPTTFSYIVGNVTIELARMIEQARAGQILVGDFEIPVTQESAESKKTLSAVEFIERAQDRLSDLKGMILGGDPVASIKCYLTGSSQKDSRFAIHKYQIKDKHGFVRNAFNAKVNIHRISGDPIFLGIQDSELSDFGVARWAVKSPGHAGPAIEGRQG